MKWILAGALLLGPGLRAQNLAGTWQGMITDNGSTYRQIFRFSKADSGWKTVYYSLDEASDSVNASNVTFDGRTLKVTFPPYFGSRKGASYEAVLAPDGRSLTGTFVEPPAYPLTVRRVRAKEMWAAAPPPHTVRFIQVEPGVKLEVLDWGGTGRPLVFLSGLGDAARRTRRTCCARCAHFSRRWRRSYLTP